LIICQFHQRLTELQLTTNVDRRKSKQMVYKWTVPVLRKQANALGIKADLTKSFSLYCKILTKFAALFKSRRKPLSLLC